MLPRGRRGTSDGEKYPRRRVIYISRAFLFNSCAFKFRDENIKNELSRIRLKPITNVTITTSARARFRCHHRRRQNRRPSENSTHRDKCFTFVRRLKRAAGCRFERFRKNIRYVIYGVAQINGITVNLRNFFPN